jgi:hypothetical protein
MELDDPDNPAAITAYVLNAERTKLLMLYDEQVDHWQPVTGLIQEDELSHQCAQRAVRQLTGLEADPLLRHELDAGWILEADETAIEPVRLVEEYDAQWLERTEIMACPHMNRRVKHFAQRYLG